MNRGRRELAKCPQHGKTQGGARGDGGAGQEQGLSPEGKGQIQAVGKREVTGHSPDGAKVQDQARPGMEP